jgi:hypothetical protein
LQSTEQEISCQAFPPFIPKVAFRGQFPLFHWLSIGLAWVNVNNNRLFRTYKAVNYPAHRAGHLKKLDEGDCIPLPPAPHSSPSTGRGILREGSVDTHGLTPVALKPKSQPKEPYAFTHGLTPVVLSAALIASSLHGLMQCQRYIPIHIVCYEIDFS